jgi:hypothetical protein
MARVRKERPISLDGPFPYIAFQCSRSSSIPSFDRPAIFAASISRSTAARRFTIDSRRSNRFHGSCVILLWSGNPIAPMTHTLLDSRVVSSPAVARDSQLIPRNRPQTKRFGAYLGGVLRTLLRDYFSAPIPQRSTRLPVRRYCRRFLRPSAKPERPDISRKARTSEHFARRDDLISGTISTACASRQLC